MADKEEENIGSFYMGRTHFSAEPKRFLPPGALTTIMLLSLLGIIWYAYPRGADKYTDVDVPVVKADTTPIKALPDDPGGMEIRHQDSTVFDPLEKNSAAEVEKLLPAPEEPLVRDRMTKADEPVKPTETPVKMEPKLNLELQMKDAGSGTEKVVPVQPPTPASAMAKPAAPAKPAPAAVAASVPVPASATPVVAGQFKIQLGSYRDMEGAEKDWKRLQKKYPDFFMKQEMKTVQVDLPGKGIYHRLFAVNLPQERAHDVCAVLQIDSPGGCIVSKQ
jgi:hypothetical protein